MIDREENLRFLCRADNDFVIDKSIINAIVNDSEVMMVIFDMDGKIDRVNGFMQEKLGYSEGEIIGRHVMEFHFNEEDKEVNWSLLKRLSVGEPVKKHENSLRTKDGNVLRVLWNNSPLYDSSQCQKGILSIGVDMTEKRDLERKLFNLAYYDSLTGLPNRAHLQMDFEQIKRSVGENEELALILMDIDNFRHINEMLGHDYGDRLLKYIARILDYQVEEPDRIYRVSGDEFVLIYKITGGKGELDERIIELRRYLSRRWLLEGEDFFVSFSMGVALFGAEMDNLTLLMQNANIAMERAKEWGKDRFVYYNANLRDRAIDNIVLGNQLRNAVDREEFVLYYQTKVALREKSRVKGVEALIRWKHPNKGLIMPGKFIPFAEDGILINDIGRWVLKQACKQKAIWDKRGHDIKIAVNFSGKDFTDPSFVKNVMNILKEYGQRPSGFEIEITESAVMSDPDRVRKVIESLKEAGFTLGLDDFGQGFSSLNYLRNYPVDFLKIDREFINSINTNETGEHILKSIIDLAHKLKIETIAEGVEKDEQAQYLLDAGCDYAQGYFYSRPSPPGETEVFFL